MVKGHVEGSLSLREPCQVFCNNSSYIIVIKLYKVAESQNCSIIGGMSSEILIL